MNLSSTIAGTGPTIVLLHAFPLSRLMWSESVASLQADFRVVAPDLPGFGNSAPGTQEFTMEACADHVEQLLRPMDIQEQIILLGISMGGYISFEFLRKYADRVRALVLVATHPHPDTEAIRQARFETAEFVQTRGSTLLAERMIPKLLGRTSLQLNSPLVERVRAWIAETPAESIASGCFALASRRDSVPVLPGISVPTLVIGGEEDVLVSTEQIRRLHQSIEKSTCAIVRASGHLVNLEQPEAFCNLVREFSKVLH